MTLLYILLALSVVLAVLFLVPPYAWSMLAMYVTAGGVRVVLPVIAAILLAVTPLHIPPVAAALLYWLWGRRTPKDDYPTLQEALSRGVDVLPVEWRMVYNELVRSGKVEMTPALRLMAKRQPVTFTIVTAQAMGLSALEAELYGYILNALSNFVASARATFITVLLVPSVVAVAGVLVWMVPTSGLIPVTLRNAYQVFEVAVFCLTMEYIRGKTANIV